MILILHFTVLMPYSSPVWALALSTVMLGLFHGKDLANNDSHARTAVLREAAKFDIHNIDVKPILILYSCCMASDLHVWI